MASGVGGTSEAHLGAHSQRLVGRRGEKKAVVAVGHTLLIVIYRVLKRGESYQALDPHYFDERDRKATEHRLVHRLEGLGYKVTLQPAPAAG